jgi:4,5-dihydroxyphthalate decarboxylase
MSDLRLSLACWDYDRTRALREGGVRPLGIDLTYLSLPPEQTFFRMLRFGEFDAAEMSLSSYVLTLDQSPSPYVAIPVFPSRAFRHGGIYVPAGGRVREPADLVDAGVGVPEYQMTAAVWIRGILAEHHGVPADRVRYRTGGLHDPGRREKLRLDLPDRFDVRPISAGETLDALLRSGGIDALYSARAPRSFDPASPDSPIRRLFADVRDAEERYARQTGIFPIMHTVVLRREVYERHPWVARSLLDAFTESKRLAYPDLLEVNALKTMLPWGFAEAERTIALLGKDFWPYGVDANRGTLEAFLRYSHEQGLAAKLWRPADLFVAETLESTLV